MGIWIKVKYMKMNKNIYDNNRMWSINKNDGA